MASLWLTRGDHDWNFLGARDEWLNKSVGDSLMGTHPHCCTRRFCHRRKMLAVGSDMYL